MIFYLNLHMLSTFIAVFPFLQAVAHHHHHFSLTITQPNTSPPQAKPSHDEDHHKNPSKLALAITCTKPSLGLPSPSSSTSCRRHHHHHHLWPILHPLPRHPQPPRATAVSYLMLAVTFCRMKTCCIALCSVVPCLSLCINFAHPHTC